ncbi:hypothetical protein E4O05_12585 [Treponema sp. OMZ 787]|uniref:hypothetical protein n=1 Tax=Treponema sp. OMZ 787 TaxID=2563669 RepID=UPI0020A3DA3B|nr:hypothetical protein [Treponema sp. OMZ 787]UTC62322.1 hypothetical protein E4O05_12585 [Treponema sp. OMZ 787]
MKKNKKYLRLLLLSLFTVVTLLTCKPSLGGQVDIYRPEGAITYPDTGETPIRGSFVIKGTAKDDEEVADVSVVFTNKETNAKLRPFKGSLTPTGNGNVDWEIKIDNKSTGTEKDHPLVKIYPIPDGEYEAKIIITDKQGKKAFLDKTYKIDNTPPVFIVSRPSTFAPKAGPEPASSSGESYGAVFSVVGQVGEKNTVEKLQVSVPDKNINLTGMFVSKNINAQIAKFEDEKTGAIYNSENNADPLKPFKSHMYLYDNAREFKGGASASLGNKAEWYYLRDAIYADVLRKGYTAEVISDYIAGKRGEGQGDHNENIRRLRGDKEALSALQKSMTKMTEYYTTFRLDPRKSPGFTVVNIENLLIASLNPDNASSILFKSDVTTSIIVELMRNKDDTPLVKSTSLEDIKASNIEIVLLKWNGNGTEVDSFKEGSAIPDNNSPDNPVDYANLTSTSLIKFSSFNSQADVDAAVSVQQGVLRVKCTLPSGFKEGKYLVKVKGTDIDKPGNTFTAYDDSGAINGGVYIIKFLENASGPRIRPISIEGYKNKAFRVEADITGLDENAKVYYDTKKEVDTNNLSAYEAAGKVLKNTSEKPSLYFNDNVSIDDLDDGENTIRFFARKGSGGGQDNTETKFKVDKSAPTVTLNYPDINDPQVGIITIRGTITDSYAGVDPDKTKWMIVKNTDPTPTIDTAIGGVTGWQNMVQSTTGSWNFTYNLDTIGSAAANYGTEETSGYYKIPVYILTEDTIGNKAVSTLHILFDKDGKKPVVKILAPRNGITTGGMIQLFGTASAPKGGPVAVGQVYIQFSKSGAFSGGDDGKFGTDGSPAGYISDWQAGGGQPVTYSASSGWSLEINKDGQFNPTGSATSHTVYYRLRGKHTDGTTEGNWSETRTITIDKDTPIIRNVVIVKGSVIERYESNMWVGNGNILKAQLADGSGLKKMEIRSKYLNHLKSGLPADTWTDIPSDWLSSFSANGESGYNLTIPIDNLQSIPADAEGKLKIEIQIVENTDKNFHTSNDFEFRFDTVAPSGSFGEHILINNTKFGTGSTNDTAIVSEVTDYTTGGGNINDLGILIGNTPVKITSVDTSKVEFSPSLSSAGSYNYILYKKQTLIHNTGAGNASPWVIHGVANDDGSGIKEVKAKVTVGMVSSAEAVISGTKISKQLGGQVLWSDSIDLRLLPDGDGTLQYQITDASGNTYQIADIPVTVKNKPIKVSTVTLKTKIGGIEKTFANSDTNKALTETTDQATAAKRDSTLDFVSSKFAFKDKAYSKIKVDFTGGEGSLIYKLLGGSTELHSFRDLPADKEIALTETDLTTIGNSGGTAKTITLEIWDKANGVNTVQASAFAKITIKTLFEAIDEKPPVPAILPFYWKGENDNSLYQNSRANGHIEIKDDLTSSFTDSGTGVMDKDDKVSGKISIRGTAHDDQVIKEILGQITGFTFSGISGAASGTETKLTEYNASNGTFKDVGEGTDAYNPNYVPKPDSTAATTEQDKYKEYIKKRNDFFTAKGWLFTVTSSTFDLESGHTLQWQLDWNSSKIADGVGLDKTIKITVKDASGKSDHTVSETRQVDVVPYITAIKRPTKYNTHRSSSGAYNLLRGDTVTVEGFNLTGTVTASVPGETTAVSVSGGTFTLPTTAKSGKVEITANSIEAINNSTNNSKPYNKQAQENKPETKYWTDDITIHVWNDNDEFPGSKNPIHPAMAMGSNGDLFVSFSSYSDSSTYYSKLGDLTPTKIFSIYDPSEETAIYIGTADTVNVLYAANYVSGTSFTSSANYAGGLYCYTPEAPIIYSGHKAHRFELYYHEPMLQQFGSPRLARGTNDQINITYYDRDTKSVKYSTVAHNATGNANHERPWINIDGASDTHDTQLYTGGNSVVLPAGQFDGITRAGSTAEYSSIALDAKDRAVVVYADVDTGTLRIARADKAIPMAAIDWKVKKVLPPNDPNEGLAEGYFTAKFDTEGYLHIAFRNIRGQLCYVKSTNTHKDTTNMTATDAYTFGTSSVVDDFGAWADITLEGTTPYISYLSKINAYDGIRIARYDAHLVTEWNADGTPKTKGAWNVMTAAMQYRSSNVRTCIAVAPSTVTDWKAAVGYTPGDKYRAVKFIGE